MVLCIGFFLVLGSGAPSAGAAGRQTALEVFRLLPSTIFDSTLEALNEGDKQLLLDLGRSKSWRLRLVHDDDLLVESNLSGSLVRVCLFHGPDTTVAAVGSESLGNSGLELWRCDSIGRITPEPLPPEPAVADFFTETLVLSKEVTVSMRFKLSGSVLRVIPEFWDQNGPVTLYPDKALFYRWNRGGFEKVVLPLSALQ